MSTRQQGSYQTFLIRFPDLHARQVMAAFRAISGALDSRHRGSQHLVLETWADSRGITHRLRVPADQADYVVGQLRVHLPGVRVTPEPMSPAHEWIEGVELGLTNPAHRLRVGEPDQLAAGLLAALSGLAQGETVLYQLVLAPALAEKPPVKPSSHSSWHRGRSLHGLLITPEPENDDFSDLRGKASEVNYLGVVRLAARAATPGHARQLLRRIEAALASTTSGFTRFKRRSVISKARLFERIKQGSAPLVYPGQFSVSEVAGLSAWPMGRPLVGGLPQPRARHLPATEAIAQTGLVIARSNFPGAERLLAISHLQVCSHIHIVGPTNSGKTTLCACLARQFMDAGFGLVLVEMKGDNFQRVLGLIPKHRLNDVIIVDVADTWFPLAFNTLADGDPRVAVEAICSLFAHLYRDTRGVWTREILYFGLMTLASQPGYTFVDLASLLVPRSPAMHAWRDELVRSLKDPELRNFWQRFENQPRPQQDRITQPVMDRIWQLNARPEIRRIIGQSESSFSMREVLEQRKILLINLSGLGGETAGLAGALLINSLWNAVKATRNSQPTPLFLDEFQSLLHLPIDPEDMLAKARSFKLPMILSHQHLDQLSLDMRSAIMANTRAAKIVFQTSADDARVFAREFGRQVSEDDFINLGQFEVICRLATPEGMSGPVTGVTLPPSKPTGLAERARQLSRQRYGRPAAVVDAEIEQRCTRPDNQPPHQPKLGAQKWT